MGLTGFLFARIAEDKAAAVFRAQDAPIHEVGCYYYNSTVSSRVWTEACCDCTDETRARALAECESKRRIVEWHESWPVLVETPLETEIVTPSASISGYAIRASRQVAWLTTREYVTRFGSASPTAPILRILAQPYADHPDFDPAWAL